MNTFPPPPPIRVVHLYISPGHNYVGHHGREPGTHPTLEMRHIDCVAGRGIKGDRYFDHECNYRGQITFFALETFIHLQTELGLRDVSPGATRRNVITEGVDLNDLIGQEFEVQGVRFAGVEECRPCYWMNRAFQASQVELALRGRGGLRARILTSGPITLSHGQFTRDDQGSKARADESTPDLCGIE